jgi:hypothetical protein
LGALCALVIFNRTQAATAPLGGFIPFVGIGLTAQYKTLEGDPTGTYFIADREPFWSGPPLGGPHFELALLDSGAATHILTEAAAAGFDIHAPVGEDDDGFGGINTQIIFGSGGQIELTINDPLGVYAAGLGPGQRLSSSGNLLMNTGAMRGQSSFATLEAPASWQLPNVLGLPIMAHHSLSILNSEPQIFQDPTGRTMRTPNIEFFNRGAGADQATDLGIVRRTNLKLHPTSSFIAGPLYIQNLTLNEDFEIVGHEDPLSPSVLDSAGIYIEIDATRGSRFIDDKEFLFDTGADLTVVSQLTADRLGFDVEFDQPDFIVEVEGGGGIESGIPGFYVDELNIDTVGGSFTLQNVPVAVIDVPDPKEPANTIDGILGMHVFTGRNLIVDANPAASPEGGGPPRLWIGDPVAQTHNWATIAASGNWATAGNWSAAGTPNIMWDANVANVSGSNQTAVISANSTVYRLTVSSPTTASMKVQINPGATLTTYGEALIKQGGRIELAGGKLDAQFVNIEGGVLAGEGEVFVGTGPFFGQVRNLAGRVEPGDPIGELTIDGDFSQQDSGTLAIDLSGATQITQYDHLQVERFAFLSGTLQVNLLSFAPADNTSFTILTATDGVFGEFDNLQLPPAYEWDITYGANDVVLTVLGAAVNTPGDFNFDGIVNAADYVWFRKFQDTTQNESNWRTHFAEPQTGASPFAGVPEPGPFIFAILAACRLVLFQKPRPHRLTPAAPSAMSTARRSLYCR